MRQAIGVLMGRVARICGAAAMAFGLLALGAGAALAQAEAPMVGAPTPWGMGLQASGGPIKDAISSFNSLVFWIIVAITIFVAILLVYVIWRFRAAANPNPTRTSHNTMLEIAWTVVPVLILVVIAIPSFRLIYYQDRAVDAEMTINVQGRQWYWHYAYPDHGNFTFDSYPVAQGELGQGQIRNLSVDNPLVVPVGANVRILTTGQDVIHSFFVPSLGVQKYTIPGRTLETWIRADRPGVYYGQCNQICGVNHWFMPIEVRAVPREEFNAWAEQARTRFAQGLPPGPPPSALAERAPAEASTTTLAEARR
ncbi:cytochrome c oxidase subunit II [Falsiroseomonas bella]|uniref:Cytochrome c oxidase subunit 2 n=1 Tax=Falsiroseomonas bella TaxID=2184016 RepID=A0A317FJP0_9PROT|nr:cytochrome c oxidase subunit II [Falsiroseomonas bella]PWS37868.1 cytochrome c oxidase subunit II [Falsiroseomonas bella]